MFFDMLYNITIYPIEFIIEILYYLFNNEFRSSSGISLFLLSLCINFLSLPLYNIAESWQAKERAIQDKMKPMIDNIKAVYKGDQRYLLIRTCQRINGYKTIYAFRGTLGLLIQIPFFIAAYNFVHSLTGLNGQSFLFIKDLSKPDALIKIGNISINLLPFLMTLFSLLAGFVYARKLKLKESLPLYAVSLIFLVLLYTSPSGLLFYWTINCLFSFIKNIIIEFKLYEVLVKNKFKLLKAYNVFFIFITVLFSLLLILANVERKCYLGDFNFIQNRNNNYAYFAKVKYYSKIFINSDLFTFQGNTDKLPDIVDSVYFRGTSTIFVNVDLKDKIENIDENVELYYRLSPKNYSINIYTFLLIFTIIINIGNIYNFIFYNKENLKFIFETNTHKLMLLSSSLITILSGIFIPSSLIGASPQEFNTPFYFILNNFVVSIGIFFFYPMFLYILFSKKIKNYLTLIFLFISILVLIDTFIMTGNYVNINADFIFDDTSYLLASMKDIFFNILYMLIFVSIFIIILRIKKINIILNIYLILILVLIFISAYDASKIYKLHTKSDDTYNNQNINDLFTLSKNGENIFVFILDRAIPSYWIDALERFPEYKKQLDGFVLYPNTVSFSDYTATIASLYGGYDYLPYELSVDGTNNLVDKHNEALLTIPLSLENYGYKSVLLDPVYANFYDIPDLSIFKDYTNISAYNDNAVYSYSLSKYLGGDSFDISEFSIFDKKNKFIRFSLFRMMPINLRYDFYSDKNWFLPYISKFSINSSIYNYAMLSATKDFVNIKEDGNYYNIMHNMMTHEQQFFNSDYLPGYSTTPIPEEDLYIYKDENSARHFYVNVSAINILIDFINFLKENQVYDNTKIIVVSDHGRKVNTEFFTNENMKFATWYNALLLYKDFNSKGNIEINTNFMTIADTPYLAVKHIDGVKNTFNDKLITNDYKTNGMYIIELNDWEIKSQLKYSYNFNYFYYVKNNIFDSNNWKKFEMDWNTKESKEIELK
ncbi:YidC/Oxa1 family membrane protein insertase [Brachyspira hyodysenteriae]|uniref:YidC/Oxa1 family membrane protein insertase n=1 Tax=Brachyspira hyodysenteriae TaxID=159 RepID=UPI0022CE1C05|nr:YidC/Oxa1 family membrane protein insertase [Brachyspira hyodysenteriae]MDA0079632.1 YidC/Oxa1 family membrane protein insertase [Brachyspira hyodysenteriae]